MADELVTFKLDGAITLSVLEEALKRLNHLATALAEEVAPDQRFDWVIEELEAGSAKCAFQTRTDRAEYGAEVRRGIATSLGAAKEGSVVPYSPRVDKAARAVLALVGDRTEALSVETDFGGVEISAPILFAAPRETSTVVSFGMVKGEVDALVRSKSRFVIFAEPESRPVSCYLLPDVDSDEVMPALFGRRVRVTGDIERNRYSGRITKVGQVPKEGIAILGGPRPSFEAALGVFRLPPGFSPPEDRRGHWED